MECVCEPGELLTDSYGEASCSGCRGGLVVEIEGAGAEEVFRIIDLEK